VAKAVRKHVRRKMAQARAQVALAQPAKPAVPAGAADTLSFARRLLAADRRAVTWAALAAAGVVMVAGLFLSRALNIWMDEAFTLHSTGAGPAKAWLEAIDFEAQPPLYFVLEAAWRTLNETSIAFARFPSAFFAAAAAGTIVFAAPRIAPGVPPSVVALIAALNPVFLWAAAEMRVYALALFVGAVLTWLFYEAFLVAAPTRRAWIWYTAFALAGLYTQYYVGFVLAAHFTTLLVLRGKGLRACAASMAVAAAGFLPFMPVALMHVKASGAFVNRVSFLHAVHDVANVVFVFMLPHDFNWSGLVKLSGFVAAAVLLVTLLAVGRPVLRGSAHRGLVVAWLLCLVIFVVLFAVSGVPLDPARHVVVAAPATVLVLLIFLSSLTRRRAFATALAGAAFAVFAAGTLRATYQPPLAKHGDWQRVAALLSADSSRTPIAVFPAELALPLSVYFPAAVIPIPRTMPFTVDYVHATTLSDQLDAARVLDPVRAGSPGLWVITSGSCEPSDTVYSRYNCGFLEAYLRQRYRIAKTVSFQGTLARLYMRTQAASSDQPKRNAN
jgi:hypothetical protein